MSIAEIAQRAGVSPATVSLVINGKNTVAESTAANVRAVIREMGYTPPPLERRQGRRAPRPAAQRVAVVATMPGQWLTSPVFSDVLHGMEGAARQNQASISIHRVSGEAQWAEVPQEGLSGLILFGGHPTRASLGRLGSLPCVRVMGLPDEDAWCDHVTYKNSSIGYLAARHLLDAGHRHVACLSLHGRDIMAERRRTFTLAMEAGGGTVLPLEAAGIVRPLDEGQTLDQALLAGLMSELVQAKPRVTGLFVTADMAAPPVYLHLLQRGVRPGHDITVVSCNNERSLLGSLEPMPAVVDIHAREVGARALERLMWRLQNPSAPPADLLIHPSLQKSG